MTWTMVVCHRRTLAAAALLLCMVACLVPQVCRAEPASKAREMWAPLSFEDFLKQAVCYLNDWSAVLNTKDTSWTRRYDALAASAKQEFKLTDEQTNRLEGLICEWKLRRLSGYSSELADYPLAAGSYNEAQMSFVLRRHYTERAFRVLDTVRLVRQIASILGSGKIEDARKLVGDPQNAKLSNSLIDTGGSLEPGLDRLVERWKYAEYLSPSTEHQHLRTAFTAARAEVEVSLDKVRKLMKRLDELEAAPTLDQTAVMSVFSEGIDAEVKMGLADLRGEWEILKLIPDEYQGTWAALPPNTSIPGTKNIEVQEQHNDDVSGHKVSIQNKPANDAIYSMAKSIAYGHSFTKHANEFTMLGITSKAQFAEFIDAIMRNARGNNVRNLSAGRTAYWMTLPEQ
ncbi:MAG: hypothetical protein GX139_00645 [Armatimonadetes bacterium]|nr:hypothetical protein [Armatimonadota bacterium]